MRHDDNAYNQHVQWQKTKADAQSLIPITFHWCAGFRRKASIPVSRDASRGGRGEVGAQEALMMAKGALEEAEDLKELARKSVVADSTRQKVAISRRLGGGRRKVEEANVPVGSPARRLGALAPMLRLLYQWSPEPSPGEMKRPQGVINLELISTPPKSWPVCTGLLRRSSW
jgi:hypothetical protein